MDTTWFKVFSIKFFFQIFDLEDSLGANVEIGAGDLRCPISLSNVIEVNCESGRVWIPFHTTV